MLRSGRDYYRLKICVCSRSVANYFDLTNHRSKNQKVIMHHTQGLEQHGRAAGGAIKALAAATTTAACG